MADFFQDGSMATLHRLGTGDPMRLERELEASAAARPIALVLPCHAEELGTPALNRIITELREVRFLARIVVGIDGADAGAWRRAQKVFSALPQKPVLLWNDGPRMTELLRQLARAGLDIGPGGKGRNLWMGLGHVLASGSARMVAVHDCDITTYSREMLARLCYPVARLGYDFCKGYTARFTDRLNGRVMRLLFTPLIRSLQSVLGPQEFLTFLDTFRYPLGGEASLDTDIIRHLRIPCDWGVETGMLAEVFRLCRPERICQIDVAECYDHKHRELSPDDPDKGLNKMARDIVRRVFRTLGGRGVRLDREILNSLPYPGMAAEAMRFSSADAEVNGLNYDRVEEELAVTTFERAIQTAAQEFLADPLGGPMIPDWNRVGSALPDFLPSLLHAADADNFG
ncbi:MAG: glycosyl transferase [Verrucomicrobiae bacterium]